MKNKILPILCIFILISFLLISNVFAYSIPSANDLYNLPDAEFLNAIYSHSLYNNGNNAVFVYNNNVFFVSGDNNNFYMGDNAGMYYALWKSGNGTVYKYTYSSGTLTSVTHNQNNITVQANGGVIYSNKDIGIKGSDDLFFQSAPQVVEQELTMAQILEQNSPTLEFKNLMKNVLASLIVFLVGLVAFLKAWAWLKTQLLRA